MTTDEYIDTIILHATVLGRLLRERGAEDADLFIQAEFDALDFFICRLKAQEVK